MAIAAGQYYDDPFPDGQKTRAGGACIEPVSGAFAVAVYPCIIFDLVEVRSRSMRNLMLMFVLVIVAGVAIAEDVDKPAVKQPAADAAAQIAQQADATAKAMKPVEYEPPKGYHVRVRDGETVYCRKGLALGSRIPQQFCFTLQQLKDIEERKRSMQQDVSRRQVMCTTGSACSGGG